MRTENGTKQSNVVKQALKKNNKLSTCTENTTIWLKPKMHVPKTEQWMCTTNTANMLCFRSVYIENSPPNAFLPFQFQHFAFDVTVHRPQERIVRIKSDVAQLSALEFARSTRREEQQETVCECVALCKLCSCNNRELILHEYAMQGD